MSVDNNTHAPLRLLILDGSYSIEAVRRLGIEQSVVSRDLDGFFEKVWTVHPFGNAMPGAPVFGKASAERLNDRHVFIEVADGRFPWLRRWPALNFLFGQLSLLRQLRRLVLRENVSVIRVGDPLYVGLLGWILARLTGRPLAMRVNGNNDRLRAGTLKPVYPRLLRSIRVEKMFERFLFPRTDLVAALNEENLNFALANGARPERSEIFRLGNLLAPVHFSDPARRTPDRGLLERLGIERQNFLLCVGRLVEIKCPEDTVRVLAELFRQGYRAPLVFAGDGNLRGAIAHLAEQLGVADLLVFAGALNQECLAHLCADAAVILSPLTGRALSEAALAAAPIVAYDVDWQGELIETGVTGELVADRDYLAMAASAKKLIDDRGYAERMGRAVRQRALDMLDPDKLNARERAAYRKLLALPDSGAISQSKEVQVRVEA